jgi:hypothetical protein
MLRNPIDRPFRSREEAEMEQALVAQYRELGNAELLAAVAEKQRPNNENAQPER